MKKPLTRVGALENKKNCLTKMFPFFVLNEGRDSQRWKKMKY